MLQLILICQINLLLIPDENCISMELDPVLIEKLKNQGGEAKEDISKVIKDILKKHLSL